MTARIEERSFHTRDHVRSHGRNTAYIDCPFCGAAVLVFIWSLCGGGKRCLCGAKFDGYGTARKRVELDTPDREPAVTDRQSADEETDT